MSPPVRIDFLSHCSDGDFFSTRAPKTKFRAALREFRDLLSDESNTGFDLFRGKMETAVHLVVNDAVGGSVASFDVALNVLDSLSRHFQAVRDETAKTYLRTIRWGISGFQVFKSMDATSRLAGTLNQNHATIANCVKDHWSVIAYVQMEMIVCCLEWLHGALVAWNNVQEEARASRASSSEQSSVADPTERPSTPNVPAPMEPGTPQYTIDPSTHNYAANAPPAVSSGLPRAPPPSTSTLEQMLSSLSTGPSPLPSGPTPFSSGPPAGLGLSSPSTSRIMSSIESTFEEASRLSAARDGQASYPATFNAPSPFRMSSPFHAGPSQSFSDSTPPSFLSGPSSSSIMNGPSPSFLDTSSQTFGNGLSQSFNNGPQQSFMSGSSPQSFINGSPQSFNNGPSQSFNNGPSQSFINVPSQSFLSGPSQQSFMNGPSQSFLSGQQSYLNGSPQSFSNGSSQQSFNNGLQQSFNNGPSQSFSTGPSQQSLNNGMQQSFNNGLQQSFSNAPSQSFTNTSPRSFSSSSPQRFGNVQQQSFSNAPSQSFTEGPSHPTQPQPPQVSAPPRPPMPAAPRVPPSIAAAQFTAPVTVDVSSPPRPSTAKANVIVTPKVLSKLATDVLKELRTRSCLGMKPRHYAKCKRDNWCTSASCSYGHTKEELKIIGIARAIARGGMWKTSVCDKLPKCPYGIGCDYLHDDDKRETIHAIKSHASQLVDHTYVTDGQLFIEFYNGETVTIAT